jgi:hypothetical protein
MRRILALLLLLPLGRPLWADDTAAQPTAQATAVVDSSDSAAVSGALDSQTPGARKVSPGMAYGANCFAGLGLGAILGAAIGAIPYAKDRQGQDPSTIILGAIYGAAGGGVGLGIPLSAYEVASDKPESGITVLYDSITFALLGGAVGAGGGMISYRHKVGQDPQDAEDFLAAAAGGICGGAALGFGVGLYETVWWPGHQQRIPGKGIHAEAGLLAFSPWMDGPGGARAIPNATLLRAEF